jgi:hypothetical protein
MTEGLDDRPVQATAAGVPGKAAWHCSPIACLSNRGACAGVCGHAA